MEEAFSIAQIMKEAKRSKKQGLL